MDFPPVCSVQTFSLDESKSTAYLACSAPLTTLALRQYPGPLGTVRRLVIAQHLQQPAAGNSLLVAIQIFVGRCSQSPLKICVGIDAIWFQTGFKGVPVLLGPVSLCGWCDAHILKICVAFHIGWALTSRWPRSSCAIGFSVVSGPFQSQRRRFQSSPEAQEEVCP